MSGSNGLSFGHALGAQAAGNAVNGLFGFFSNLINNNAQKKLYEQQYRDSIDFYNMQMQDQWDMWNANNEYNSPANQASRLREAGINPDLQGVDNVSASMPSAPTPNVPQQGYTPLSADIFALMPSILETAERLQSIDMNSFSLDNAMQQSIDERLLSVLTREDIESLKNEKFDFRMLSTDFWDSVPQLSKQSRRRYENYVYQRMRNPEVWRRYQEGLTGESSSIFDFEKITGNPLFSPDGTASKDLSDFLQLVNDVDQATMKYNRDYYNTASGSAAGESSNVGNEAIIQQKGIVNDMIDDFLSVKDNKDGTGPSAFRQFLAVLARMLINGQFSGPNVKIGPTNNTFLKTQ